MPIAQLDRLKSDALELEIYARRLKKRGNTEKMLAIERKLSILRRIIETNQF